MQNKKLLPHLRTIYLSVPEISPINFLYKILETDNEEMIFQIFDIFEFKKRILLNIQLIIKIFHIITPPEYIHLYDKLIEYFNKYYNYKIYENYHYQKKYIKYKQKYLQLKNI